MGEGVCGDIHSAPAGGPRYGAADQLAGQYYRVMDQSVQLFHGGIFLAVAGRRTGSPERHGGGHRVGSRQHQFEVVR